jgi:hypothetical protein
LIVGKTGPLVDISEWNQPLFEDFSVVITNDVNSAGDIFDGTFGACVVCLGEETDRAIRDVFERTYPLSGLFIAVVPEHQPFEVPRARVTRFPASLPMAVLVNRIRRRLDEEVC